MTGGGGKSSSETGRDTAEEIQAGTPQDTVQISVPDCSSSSSLPLSVCVLLSPTKCTAEVAATATEATTLASS